MKKIFALITIISLCLSFYSCKKENMYKAEVKNGVKIYNWFTLENYDYNKCWVRKSGDKIWTWYDITYRVLEPNSDKFTEFQIPYSKLSPGFNAYNAYRNSIFLNTSNNIEHAYFDLTDFGPDPSYKYTFLCKNEIDNNGNIINQDSVYIDYFPNAWIGSLKHTKTATSRYFAYDYTVQEPTSFEYYSDTLYILKTDLNMNKQAIYKRAVYDSANCNGCTTTIYDIQSNDNITCITYFDGMIGSWGESTIEILDNNLNTLNKINTTDLPGSSAWCGGTPFQKIIIKNNKILVLGNTFYDCTHSAILITTLDLSGNFVSNAMIQGKKAYVNLRGVEPTNDGKYLLYYDESDVSSWSSTLAYVGVCKTDDNGNTDYKIVFPENEASGYSPCLAFEGSDGNINIYAKKNYNNSAVQQTIYVKLNKEGKIQ